MTDAEFSLQPRSTHDNLADTFTTPLLSMCIWDNIVLDTGLSAGGRGGDISVRQHQDKIWDYYCMFRSLSYVVLYITRYG